MNPPARHPALDPGEDARLVEQALGGDARAWAALVSRHERLVYAVARSYRLSDADLGDVFQEVFAALVRGLPRIRDARALVRWLSSTTERIARATALRRRREQALRAPDPEAVETFAADQPAVGADLEMLEERALLRLALSRLPEGCRRLLSALYYEDPVPDYAALARRLHMPIGSLGPTRARCIERMRRALGQLGGGAEGISTPTDATFKSGGSPPGSTAPGETVPRDVEKRR